MNIIDYNRRAWNRESAEGGEWSTPVDEQTIRNARSGDWEVILTPTRPVPRTWFGNLAGATVLCLASGGGQQAPVIAAAGARVISFDLSEEQLAKDRGVARREGLQLSCVQGDMRDLSALRGQYFDLVFHPVSNLFVPDVRPVWRECYRVLKPGGALLAGFVNPAMFLFDHEEAEETGALTVKHTLPYSDTGTLTEEARRRWLESGRAAEFSHSLETQIGGQLDAGFIIAGFFEDTWSDEATPLNRHMPLYIATRSYKPV